MRVLLDECVDWRLGRELASHEVKTARQMGWTTLKNGDLLALASAQFVTVDRNLSFQQDMASFAIAVVVLQARTKMDEERFRRGAARCGRAAGFYRRKGDPGVDAPQPWQAAEGGQKGQPDAAARPGGWQARINEVLRQNMPRRQK